MQCSKPCKFRSLVAIAASAPTHRVLRAVLKPARCCERSTSPSRSLGPRVALRTKPTSRSWSPSRSPGCPHRGHREKSRSHVHHHKVHREMSQSHVNWHNGGNCRSAESAQSASLSSHGADQSWSQACRDHPPQLAKRCNASGDHGHEETSTDMYFQSFREDCTP